MYVIYGSQASLFTRKLEAAAIFYGLPVELKSKRAQQNIGKLKAAPAPIKYRCCRRRKTG